MYNSFYHKKILFLIKLNVIIKYDMLKVVEFPNFIWETKRTDGYARWKLKLHGYKLKISYVNPILIYL